MHRNNNIKKNNILILVMILTIRRIKTGEQYFHKHSRVLKKKNQKKVENQPSTTLTAALTKTKTTDQFRDIRKIYRHFM